MASELRNTLQAKAEIKRLNDELERVAERTPKRPLILRNGVAVLSVTAALIIARLLEINLVPAPGMVFLCALMFSAWYGGLKPSLLAMALSLLAFKYYFVTPIHSLTVEIKEIPRLFIFSLLSAFVVWLSAAQRKKAESLKQARDILDETVQELKRTNQALRAEITERKRAEEKLKATSEQLRALSACIHSGSRPREVPLMSPLEHLVFTHRRKLSRSGTIAD